ncbi:hypothetical protein ACW4TU_09580 [Streptomyces sp. QTS52]
MTKRGTHRLARLTGTAAAGAALVLTAQAPASAAGPYPVYFQTSTIPAEFNSIRPVHPNVSYPCNTVVRSASRTSATGGYPLMKSKGNKQEFQGYTSKDCSTGGGTSITVTFGDPTMTDPSNGQPYYLLDWR